MLKYYCVELLKLLIYFLKTNIPRGYFCVKIALVASGVPGARPCGPAEQQPSRDRRGTGAALQAEAAPREGAVQTQGAHGALHGGECPPYP